jgi:DNA-binding transcriptional LysR family regulator
VHGFDPASTSRRFRIAMSELGEIGWLPGVANKMSVAAPMAQIEVIPLDPATLPEMLKRGIVDVALTPVDLGNQFHSTVAKWQAYRVAMSAGNPLAEGGLTATEFLEAPRAVVLGDSGAPILEAAESRAGLLTEPVVLLQHYATLPPLLIARPTLIAAVPSSIAEGWTAGWPLKFMPLPFAMDPVQIRVYRRAATQQPAALDWFYRLVCSVVSSTVGRFDTIQGRDTHPQ